MSSEQFIEFDGDKKERKEQENTSEKGLNWINEKLEKTKQEFLKHKTDFLQGGGLIAVLSSPAVFLEAGQLISAGHPTAGLLLGFESIAQAFAGCGLLGAGDYGGNTEYGIDLTKENFGGAIRGPGVKKR